MNCIEGKEKWKIDCMVRVIIVCNKFYLVNLFLVVMIIFEWKFVYWMVFIVNSMFNWYEIVL